MGFKYTEFFLRTILKCSFVQTDQSETQPSLTVEKRSFKEKKLLYTSLSFCLFASFLELNNVSDENKKPKISIL